MKNTLFFILLSAAFGNSLALEKDFGETTLEVRSSRKINSSDGAQVYAYAILKTNAEKVVSEGIICLPSNQETHLKLLSLFPTIESLRIRITNSYLLNGDQIILISKFPNIKEIKLEGDDRDLAKTDWQSLASISTLRRVVLSSRSEVLLTESIDSLCGALKSSPWKQDFEFSSVLELGTSKRKKQINELQDYQFAIKNKLGPEAEVTAATDEKTNRATLKLKKKQHEERRPEKR